MKKYHAALVAGTLFIGGCTGASHTPATVGKGNLEPDSAAAIQSRLAADFPYTMEEGIAKIKEAYPQVTDSAIAEGIEKGYIETMDFDGERRMFRKAIRNYALLAPDLRGPAKLRGEAASPQRMAYVDSLLSWYAGKNPLGAAHKVVYKFTIDVPNADELLGDTLRVWMPLPFESSRQSDIEIISTDPEEYVLTDGRSVHNSIYFARPVGASGDTTHFECVVSFVTRGEYFAPENILKNLKPYDKNSALYREYTSVEKPHIIRLDSLAHAIVGDETNPYRQSELVYDYIVRTYPWAGAREYSTIDCIPAYVQREGHGDCGQVSLLYISLMRTLGVPARWESGWMLHPGEKNLHDWAEVYFEGVGWVPVDQSFGRYIMSDNEAVQKFYSTGMDAHRFAANKGVCGEMYPKKKFVRSETVDFQLGEVETSKGNLFYPGWDQHLELISVTPTQVEKQ